MGKYFEELNLTECNDASMGIIYESIRLAQRLIARMMVVYMSTWERLNMKTRKCARTNTQAYTCVSLCQTFMNYYKNEESKSYGRG